MNVTMPNCSFDEVDNLMKTMELVIYIPVFIVGLALNVMALMAFCFLLSKWTESTIYMTNLAVMDLVLLFQLPFKMHATNHLWPGDLRVLCSSLESLYFVGMYGSIYTIMCIAVDRYVAIRHPFKAKQIRSPKVACAVCGMIWVLVLAAFSPVYTFRKPGKKDFHCFHGFSNKSWEPLLIVSLEVFGFLVPVLVLVFCSFQIIRTLEQSGQQSPKNKACVRIIYSSLCAFILPFSPSHLAILLQFLVHQGVIVDCSTKLRISLFIQLAMSLANMSCCLDAVCYYFIAKEVRSSKNSFRWSVSTRRATFSTSEV